MSCTAPAKVATWTCAECTLVNDAGKEVCEACRAPRTLVCECEPVALFAEAAASNAKAKTRRRASTPDMPLEARQRAPGGGAPKKEKLVDKLDAFVKELPSATFHIVAKIDGIECCTLASTEPISSFKAAALRIKWKQEITDLSLSQRSAMEILAARSRISHLKASPKLYDRYAKLGINEQQVKGVLEYLRNDALLLIHLDLDKVGKYLIQDEYYRSQWETQTSSGAGLMRRRCWEQHLFDDVYDASTYHERPKYGVLDVMNHYKGVHCAKGYGDSYAVLKVARDRVTTASEDSGMLVDGLARVDWRVGAHLGTLDNMAHVLCEYTDKELLALGNRDSTQIAGGRYKEIQIHGPIALASHIDRLVVNVRHRDPNAAFGVPQLKELTNKHGFNFVFMDAESRARRQVKVPNLTRNAR